VKSRRLLVVSNAGPLIHLAKINLLFLLRNLYGEIAITDEVKVETVDRGVEKGFADAFQIKDAINEGWIKVVTFNIPGEFSEMTRIAGLKTAEAAVIYHAYKNKGLALLDEDSARTLARTLDISVRGTLGIILESVEKKHLTLTEALKALDRLSEIMFLSADLYKTIRKEMEKTHPD
jgi:predicted nucleic acid-binding protein